MGAWEKQVTTSPLPPTHSIILVRPQTSSRQHQPIPSQCSLSQSRGGRVPEATLSRRQTIMKMGCFSSLTFLMYIHNQIGRISKELAQTMSRPIPFLNISDI